MTYGARYGVPVGARFQSRRSLYDARVHRDIRRNICGGPDRTRGAESVLVSGRDEDDLDLGQIVYYTGSGKRSHDGRILAHQEFSGLNRSLAMNAETAQPVRLIRLVDAAFEYGGLYAVEDAFHRRGVRGFLICQYRMRSIQPPDAPMDTGVRATVVKRALTTHYRLVRDAGVPARIKDLYDYHCQICGVRIETLAGPYSEGAHIVPLGGGADGPDIDGNVLSLCPNHHVMLDHGAIYITDSMAVLDRSGVQIATLHVHPDHRIDIAHLQAHRRLIGLHPSHTDDASFD